jgi:hypothetical protein
MNNTSTYDTPPTVETPPVEELDRPEPLDPKRLKRNPLMSKVSWMLVAGLIACGGFVVGAKSNESSSAAGGFPGASGAGSGGFPAIPAGFDISSILGGGTSGKSTKDLAAATTSSGEIVLVSGGKIYVKLADGSSKAVSITSGTAIRTSTAVDSSALKVGQRVLVDGRSEENGVIAANAVVLQPK